MLLNQYRSKLKTVDELLSMFGKRPTKGEARNIRLVLCHGAFDIVHPGHVHHLLYAKSKADVLVVGVTADRFISKGSHRPHVPQEMRALNLAAFSMVDYVVIDDHDGPEELLRTLQPDYYAKGFEYAEAQRGRPLSHANIVEDYGGEVLFTPGDVVYSSSKLLKVSPPDLRYEKLALLMSTAGVGFDQLRSTLDWIGSDVRVHVVGDTIVDTYTHCAHLGAQAKTPTISARVESRTDYVGGAAIVALHMAAAGADVVFSTVLGKDRLGDWVVEQLLNRVAVNAIWDGSRPTTNKNTIIVDGYRLLKVDTVDNRSISGPALQSLTKAISARADVLAFADFRHGIFNRNTIPELMAARPQGALLVADSQVASRWGNILEFEGANFITPNEKEARFALGDQDSGVRPLASELYSRMRCGTLFLKMGDKGVLVCTDTGPEPSRFFTIDSFVKKLVDPVGAGDAMLAYATLGLRVSNNPVIAAILGAFAAAVECEMDGNFPITSQYVMSKIDEVEGLMLS